MSSIKSVALLGANGNLGPAILEALVASSFVVTVLKRASSTSPSNYPPQVRVLSIPDDLDSQALEPLLKGQDAVIACIKGSEVDAQKRLADASAAAGVRRFIPADFGSCDSQSDYTQRLVPLYKRKTEIREYLQTLAQKYPTFSWTSLVPGHFFDWSLQFIHIFLSDRHADILDNGDTKFSISTLHRIGEATARVLQRSEDTVNRILYVQSFRITQKEVIAAYEKATGVTWEVGKFDSAQFEKEQKAKADAGSAQAIEELVWLLGTIDADWTVREGYAMDLLGLEDENLDKVVHDIVARQS